MFNGRIVLLIIFLVALHNTCLSQTGFVISGKISEEGTMKPIQNATVHLKGSNLSALSTINGGFKIRTQIWYDSLKITCVGFEPVTIALQKNRVMGLSISMENKPKTLDKVVVNASKRPGKSFMEKVIENKNNNNPSRFRSYSYQRYTRNELDIDNINFQKAKGAGLKCLLLKTYAGLDSAAITDKELPVYFDECLANNYYSLSPRIDQENIIAKKNLGLKTDALLSKLDKFYFHFNVYDDWLPIFDQTYVSPVNSNAFRYYTFFEGDTLVENGVTIQQIRFVPLRENEKAFNGMLWINKNTLAVENVEMRLNKTANLNFIRDIIYSEDYKLVYDSSSEKMVYMPYKYFSEVKFESGLDLLGIPVPENKNTVKFIFKNTTVIAKLNLRTSGPSMVVGNFVRKEKTVDWYKTDEYWQKNRPESLTNHERNIYKMVDSLKENNRFQRDAKLVAFA